MVAALLDEGAGELDAAAFQGRLEELAIELQLPRAARPFLRHAAHARATTAGRASSCCGLRSMSRASTPSAIERIRAQVMARLQRETASPNDIATEPVVGDRVSRSPYGRPVERHAGIASPLIDAEDLESYVRRVFARDTLKVAVVGDIDAATAGAACSTGLSARCRRSPSCTPVPARASQGLGRRIVVDLDVPQTVLTFGGAGIAAQRSRLHPGLRRQSHPRRRLVLVAALSRGAREARASPIRSTPTCLPLDHTALLMGATATRADRAGETLDDHRGRKSAAWPRDGPTAGGAGQGEVVPEGLVCAALRHLDQDRRPACADPDRRSRHRLYRAPQRADRCRHHRGRQARRPSACVDGGLLVTVVGRPQGVASTEPAALRG